jgi:hypothetical protein
MGILTGQVQIHLEEKLSVICLHSLCALFSLCHNGVMSACFNSTSAVQLLNSSSQEERTQKIIGKKCFLGGCTNQGDFDANLNLKD